MTQTPDLLSTLDRIQAEARRGRENFGYDKRINGHTALQKIETLAKDAIDDVKEAVKS
jgi:hypothetical protein